MFTHEEYIRLVMVIGGDAAQKAEPEQVGNGWQFKQGCPGYTKTGCILPYDQHPIVCKLYPFMPTPTRNLGTMLLLDTQCPYWQIFGKERIKALNELKKHEMEFTLQV